jgi:small nuclear ribonucleoprotein (snRNP)-like protein
MVIKPDDLLKFSLNKPVLVILKNGEEVKGILRNYDDYINLTLETYTGEEGSRAGNKIIKGSKIMLISTQ